MAQPAITNFKVRKLDNSQGELDLARKKWADSEFIPNDDYWLAYFELNGEKHAAGIRGGRRIDVATDTVQFNVQLNVRDEAFESDTFIPEAEVADITKAVSKIFVNGEYWKTKGEVVVFGTDHRLQGSPNYPRSITDPGYSDELRRIISDESIDFVFEEASHCGRTTAARLVQSLGTIRYLDVDPHFTALHEFGIVSASGDPFPTDDIGPYERLDEDIQREQLWCKTIDAQKFRVGLLICGHLHTLSMAFRLRALGFRVKFHPYVPYDLLCSHQQPR